MNSKSRVCLVHDWLVDEGGAEKVLLELIDLFKPEKIFTLIDFINPEYKNWDHDCKIETSFLQKIPFIKKLYRYLLPIMPIAVSSLRVQEFDIVISSSHAVAKGVITKPSATHICICYSPMRYVWDLQEQYLEEVKLAKGIRSFLIRILLNKIRIWDVISSNGVDHFIAISQFIQKRINKFYKRDSTVIYPPVDINKFNINLSPKRDQYITYSRLVPYKKVDLIVRTFTEDFPDKTLCVIGNGPEFKKIQKIAGNNIRMLGRISDESLIEEISKSKAYIYAAEEDFGISIIEAQAAGLPVVAFKAGAAVELINDLDHSMPTGILYNSQSKESLSDAIRTFDLNESRFVLSEIKRNSLRFSIQNFRTKMINHYNEIINQNGRI